MKKFCFCRYYTLRKCSNLAKCGALTFRVTQAMPRPPLMPTNKCENPITLLYTSDNHFEPEKTQSNILYRGCLTAYSWSRQSSALLPLLNVVVKVLLLCFRYLLILEVVLSQWILIIKRLFNQITIWSLNHFKAVV